MILFLTLCYVAVLYALVRLHVLPDNLLVRSSPIGFSLLLFLFLFVPMQWGAPAGPAVVVRAAVQIVPNVAGQVIEVPVKPNKPLRKGDVLFRIDPTQYQARFDNLEAQLKLAQLRKEQYTELAAKDATSRFKVEEVNAAVVSLEAQVADAKWQLDNTVVKAPTDGFVTNVALTAGARVAAVPMAAAMPFIDTSGAVVGAQIGQNYVRYIEPGQNADVTFKQLPGQVFKATVESVLPAIAQGQVVVSGMAVQSQPLAPIPYIVRLKLEDPSVTAKLHAGAFGQVAIYTSSMQVAHVIRKVMMWMQAWMNYLV
jgi:multidrug resistance efflux pump